MRDLVDRMLAYEQDDLDHDDTVALFQDLYQSGVIWHLQGHYQRVLQDLMVAGDIGPMAPASAGKEDSTMAT